MKENEKRNINLGIQILRFLLCLWILIIHCSYIENRHKKYFDKGFHVPTFILLSFYFFYNNISRRNIPKIILRFQRLLIPYILWPIIILLVNNFLISLFSVGQFRLPLKKKDLFIQLLIGLRYHPIFYYQFNLLFLSLLFTILSFIFRLNLLKILIYLGLLSFYLHISTLNYNYFIYYQRSFQISLGTIVELLPIAVIGSALASKNMLSKMENISLYFKLILIFIIFILFEYDIFTSLKGFFFHNVLLNILASNVLFTFFGSLSFEKIKKFKIIISIIMNFTNFTGGIYYIHPIFRDYLSKYSLFYKKRNYSTSFSIYIMCYIFCFTGSTIFNNYRLKYLFI